MLDLYTIATKASHIKNRCKLFQEFNYKHSYQARPNMLLPIIISENGKPKLVNAYWKLSSNTTTIATNKILTSPPYNLLIRKKRCAIPANCFFGIKDNHPYLIRLIQPRLFLIGGIYTQKNDVYQFAILKTEPTDILSFLDYSPVLFTTEKINTWLTTQHLESVMNIADHSGNFWFDYFKVSKTILNPSANERSLLTPIELSHQKIMERNQKLNELTFNQERPNRRNYK